MGKWGQYFRLQTITKERRQWARTGRCLPIGRKTIDELASISKMHAVNVRAEIWFFRI